MFKKFQGAQVFKKLALAKKLKRPQLAEEGVKAQLLKAFKNLGEKNGHDFLGVQGTDPHKVFRKFFFDISSSDASEIRRFFSHNFYLRIWKELLGIVLSFLLFFVRNTWMSCWKLGSKVRISGLYPQYTVFISR